MPFSRRGFAALSLLALWRGASVASAGDKKHPAEEAGLASGDGDIAAKITFVNKSKQAIKVFWLNRDGDRVFYKTLEDGDSYEQPTFLTHPWLVTNEADDAWYVYFPDGQPRTIEVVKPPKN